MEDVCPQVIHEVAISFIKEVLNPQGSLRSDIDAPLFSELVYGCLCSCCANLLVFEPPTLVVYLAESFQKILVAVRNLLRIVDIAFAAL